MEQVERVLYSYRSLKRASKRLRRRAYTINDGVKSGYKAAGVIPGRVSASYNQSNIVEDNIIRNDDLLCRAKRADELRKIIQEDVEELRKDDPEVGEEMSKVIELKYFKKYKNRKIEIELAISDATLYRRRVKALELLEQKGLQLLFGEIMSII
ncbi:hypothetical protein [Orenia marismortui]|uniref:Uncharacterized protein n=1 Tax=Orenia marismortui TaxID=46469 RepID=A0A4R8GZQ7_9FIRM|nr:hypothetical protein [Orenia marismortui]TDX52153.1 hypothetical protein C7959_10875 [Orenia marismortui]